MRRVPAVALAQDPLPVADPVAIRDVGADDRPRRRGAHRGVAAEVVDVGVGDQHIVEVGRVEPQLAEGGQDHLVGRRGDPGVDQERSLIAQQVLRERARSQDALDAVDARGDLMRRHQGLHKTKTNMSSERIILTLLASVDLCGYHHHHLTLIGGRAELAAHHIPVAVSAISTGAHRSARSRGCEPLAGPGYEGSIGTSGSLMPLTGAVT